MTEVKALSPPPKFLALPNYSQGLSNYFVEPEIVNSLISDLAELVSIRVAELRLENAEHSLNKCRARIFREAKEERHDPWRMQLRLHLQEFIEGASLVVNPLPKRRFRRPFTDYEALHSDWLNAVSDANKVWHAFSYCLEPFAKNLDDDTAARRPQRKKTRTADR
jgi:hypothetical protein